jgi:predicted Zn-dependent protease
MKNLLLISLFISVTACHRNAVTGKRSLTLMPESDLMAMSVTEYDKFLSQNPPLPESDERVRLVRKVGTRIEKAVEQFHAEKNASKDLEGFAWQFNVVDQKEVNAWCMPGGKVVVYTGLLPVTRDEQSLAIVLGHEIAHAIARHGNQRMSEGMLVQMGGTVLSVALSQKPALTQQLFQQAYGVSTGLGTLAYSRSQESEADKMGLVFAAMAGYDPRLAIPFWERMAAQSNGSAPPALLSDHPSDEKRIKDIKDYMPEAMRYYKPS